jgi:hypothetical protein
VRWVNINGMSTNITEKLKNVGLGVGGLVISLVFLALLLAISVTFLFGLTWVSVKVLPWLKPAFLLALAASIFLCGPLALFRRTRGTAAAGLMIASYVFGAILWITALLLTYQLWGTIAVVIGLLIVGVGIVPIALLATIFSAEWWHLADLVVLLLLTFGIRFLALWLADKAGERQVIIDG